MVNYKTLLKITDKGDKYELDGGQNRVNSADYIYMIYKNGDYLLTVGYQTIRTGKLRFEDLSSLPDIVIKKIKNCLND